MEDHTKVKGCLIEKKGKYYAVIYYYVDGVRLTETKATGISVTAHKKKEAEKIKDRLIMEKHKELEQSELKKGQHSFADCMERWVEYKAQEVESTTAEGYRNHCKAIVEYFRKKEITIENLRPKDVLAYYEWALQYGRRKVNKDGSTALSRRTVRDQATLIKKFLSYAVVEGIIQSNPADNVSVPRVRQDNTEEIAFMDLEQAKEFLRFVKENKRFHVLYYMGKLGFYYGFRRSELLGLRWRAVDFEKDSIVVNHTVVRVANELEHRDNVKTKSSHRYLPLLGEVKECLHELKAWQEEQGIYSEDGYIFLWEDGREYNPDYISKLFKKAIKACPNAPKDMTLHGLRHSCCAILFEKGWDLGKVQNWLGHSDITVTANIYNHVSKKWKNAQGKKIDGFLE